MNSNDDYLWEKSGEPDPEVQQLEEILGTLRYQPRPLELPADLKTDPKPRNILGFAPRLAPGLAIAATIAILLLGLGLWLGLQRLQRSQPQETAREGNTPPSGSNPVSAPPGNPNENQNSSVASAPPGLKENHNDRPRHPKSNSPVLAKNTSGARHQVHKVNNSQLAKNELREGKAAKDQLVLALRLASAKLNFAQKKTQSTSPRDAIHNQHKIG